MNVNLKMTLGSFLELPDVKDTIIGELINTMLAGKFDEPQTEVEEGEKQIGEMNLLEKAIFTVFEKIRKEHGALHKPGAEHDKIKCEMLNKTGDALGNLLWTSIKKRLSKEVFKEEVGGTGIRKDFKIVTFPKRSSGGIGIMEIFAGRF